MNLFTSRTALSLGALSLLGLLSSVPALAQTPALDATFSAPTAGAPDSGIGGIGYTPYYFDITFDNTTANTYHIDTSLMPPTFNSNDPTTSGYIQNGDIFTLYDPNSMYPSFDLAPGVTSQTLAFEFDIDGAIPSGTTLLGDLDFEGTLGNQNLTVADPSFSFVTPSSSVPSSSVPEPASYAAFITGSFGLLCLGLKARKIK